MPIVSEQNRMVLKSMGRDHVEKAMELFNRKFRNDFEEPRWRRWTLLHNGKSYPPKDLLRCVIAVMNNSSYDRDSVIGGGDSINRYFTNLGFTIADNKKTSDGGTRVILRKGASSGSLDDTIAGETPTREDLERLLRLLGREVDEDVLKAAVVSDFAEKGRPLNPDWWDITKTNLMEWSKKR